MATNFLWYAGSTPPNGLLTAASVTAISSEMVSLGSSAVAVGATTITSTYTGQGIWAEIFLTLGTSIAAPIAGGNICGWFLTSPDGGTTFESSVNFNPGPPRPPDFLVPSSTLAQGSSSVLKAVGPLMIPALPFKVAVQNNLQVTFSTSNAGYPTLKIAPIAMQY